MSRSSLARGLVAVVVAAGASAAVLASAPAHAQTSSTACFNIQVTSGRVAIRAFPRTNAQVLRVVSRGTTLRTCGILSNSTSGYHKCGWDGFNWHRLSQTGLPRTSATDVLGRSQSAFGWFPAKCAV